MPAIDLFQWRERAPLPWPRSFYAAGILDGKFVVAGGTYWQDDRKIWCDRVDAFDPLANRWESAAAMPRPQGEGACVICGGALYVLGGGADGSVEAAVWAFQRGAWSILPRMTLPEPRRLVAGAVVDGTLYILGGLARTEFASAQPTVWAAKPDGPWENRASLPGPVRFNSAVAVVGGRILMAGGATPEKGGIRNLDDVIAYDPRADEWSTVGRLPSACRGQCGLEEGSRLLIIGGYSDNFESRILGLDLQTGQVSTVGGLPHGLCETIFLRWGDRIIGVSGENAPYLRAPWTLEAKLERFV